MIFIKESDTQEDVVVVPDHVWNAVEVIFNCGLYNKFGKFGTIRFTRALWGQGTLLKSKQFVEFCAYKRGLT